MTDVTTLSALQLAVEIGKGRIKSEAVVKACLDRIAARDDAVRAWVHVAGEQALAEAREADFAVVAGHPTGPLHGVPMGVKDIIDTADMPTECGSPVFKGRQPRFDAVAVQRLRQAGAIILGKTVTTELATLTPNVTHNPHNLEHTPGGSSSGSAAAVADGMVPAALATQTGGSVIRPASFCGVYGLKPTFGLIPRGGVLDQSTSLDTVGVYGRSVEDLALIADALGGIDANDRATYRHTPGSILKSATEDFKLQPKFTFVKTPAWMTADAVTREAFGELIETLGDQVEEASVDFTIARGLEAQKTINNVELATKYGPLLDKNSDGISARLAKQIEDGRKISATKYFEALQAREVIYESFEEIFRSYSAILTPAALGPAPKGLESTGDPVFNAFWTYLGTPCVTLPLLQDEAGLPMGVQLVGARRDDGRLLRTARLFERQLAV
ncbi:MAG: amidase [Hyphomicrobiaceae bacterium]